MHFVASRPRIPLSDAERSNHDHRCQFFRSHGILFRRSSQLIAIQRNPTSLPP